MVDLEKTPEFYRDYDLSKLNKEELLKNFELAEGLAHYNEDFAKHPLAQDLDILRLKDSDVVWELAYFSDWNGWGQTPAAQDINVLKLRGGEVAFLLARISDKNGWGQTPATQDLEVLKLEKGRVAEKLAFCSEGNGWGMTPAAFNPKVLRLNDGGVAKELADRSDKNGWGDILSVCEQERLNFFSNKEKNISNDEFVM